MNKKNFFGIFCKELIKERSKYSWLVKRDIEMYSFCYGLPKTYETVRKYLLDVSITEKQINTANLFIDLYEKYYK